MYFSENLLIAILAALPGTIAAVATLIVSLRNSDKADEIKKATDGMKDAMVTSARKEGHIDGMKDEKIRCAENVEANKTPGMP